MIGRRDFSCRREDVEMLSTLPEQQCYFDRREKSFVLFAKNIESFAGRYILSAFLLLLGFSGMAQAPRPGVKMSKRDSAAYQASLKTIHILSTKRLRSQQMPDSVIYQSFAGNVKLRQGKTLFYADSAVLNPMTNMAEAFGHVMIDDKDNHTVIRSEYLRYNGNERKAYLKGNVSLKDPTSVLTTPDLDYDMGARTGIYTKGGKLVNGTSVLHSQGGIYYGQTHDATFSGKVHLKDPQYKIDTDTLLYNSDSKIATFTVPTKINVEGNKNILTSDGYYDLVNKRAYFGKRPTLMDSSSTLIADEVAMEDGSGYGEARGRVVFKDTVQNMVLVSNHMMTNRNAGTFRATENPVAILKQEKGSDSLYISGDTLYSGRLSTLIAEGHNDMASLDRYHLSERKTDTSGVVRPQIEVKESVVRMTLPKNGGKIVTDSMADVVGENAIATHRLANADGETVKEKDSVTIREFPSFQPVASPASKTAAVAQNPRKTNKGKKTTATRKGPKTFTDANDGNDKDRYLEAYNHVRIFTDSMQAVGDSLFYSLADSTFRLFKNPVVWTQENQLVGDTIFLFTANRRPSRMYVFDNAIVINKSDTVSSHQFYNQVRGRTINAMFTDGQIDSIRAKGSSESVYYILDGQNKYISVDKSSSDLMDIYFADRKPVRIKKISNVMGTVTPIQYVNDPAEMQIRGFRLFEYRRPKNKYELFEPVNPEQFMITDGRQGRNTSNGALTEKQ